MCNSFFSQKSIFTLRKLFQIRNIHHLELRHLSCDVTGGTFRYWRSKAHEIPLSLLRIPCLLVSSPYFYTYNLVEHIQFFHIIVKRCVVQFCSNSNKTGHTMHKFPKEANLKRQWVKFVQVKRADFDQRSKHSVVCGSHLSPDC